MSLRKAFQFTFFFGVLLLLGGLVGGGCTRALLDMPTRTLVRLEVSPDEVEVPAGTHQEFSATAIYSDDTKEDVSEAATWSCDNSDIDFASNDSKSSRVVHAHTPGDVNLTVTYGEANAQGLLHIRQLALNSISITSPATSAPLGSVMNLIAIGYYEDGTSRDITQSVSWSSTNQAVATIGNTSSDKGRFISRSVGVTIINVAFGDTTISITINISPAELTGIDISPSLATVAKGLSSQLTATGEYSDGTTLDITSLVTWTSANANFATVNSTGLVTARIIGNTTITASYRGKIASADLTVSAASLQSIAVTAPASSVAMGLFLNLVATGTYSDGTTRILTGDAVWTSLDLNVASVSNSAGTSGRFAALHQGSVTVSAAVAGVSGNALFAVTAAELVSIEVVSNTTQSAIGYNVPFRGMGHFTDSTIVDISEQLSWSTSPTNVASVSNTTGSKGLVTTLAIGTVSVWANLNGISGHADLAVSTAVLQTLQITDGRGSHPKGTQGQLTATGFFSDGSHQDLTQSVGWSSSDATHLSVANAAGAKGLVTAVALGTSLITATSGAVTDSISLTVTPAELVAIVLSAPANSVALGRTLQVSAWGTYTDSTTLNLTSLAIWSSASTGIGTINSSGLLNSLSLGSTVVSATSSGITSNITITVTAAELVSLQVALSRSSVAKGLSSVATATGTYTDTSTRNLTNSVTWSSADTNLASVSGTGGLVGLALGSSNITASLGGVSAQANFTVTAAELLGIAVSPSSDSVALGLTRHFSATGTYTDSSTIDLTSSVTWTSNATGIATVSNTVGSKGNVSTLAQGGAIITATSGAISGSASLVVTAPTLTTIQVALGFATRAKGLTFNATATGTYTDGTTQNLTNTVAWTTSNANATVSNVAGSKGLVTAAAVGSSVITATLGTISGSANFDTLAAQLVSIAVTPNTYTLVSGIFKQFAATGTYTDASTRDVTNEADWTSSNLLAGVIGNTVNVDKGKAKGIGLGTTSITATIGAISGTATMQGLLAPGL